jgi:hypothetical protein
MDSRATEASRELRKILSIGALLCLGLATAAPGKHLQWMIDELGHEMPPSGFYEPSSRCTQECDTPEVLNDPERLRACAARNRCQPLVSRPPSPEPEACLPEDRIDDEGEFQQLCTPFPRLATHSLQSCCLQFELARFGWRGYQLHFGPWAMAEDRNDDYAYGYARIDNAANLDADSSAFGLPLDYEYMVGFEFWQHAGSHHFILHDLLGSCNDPNRPRGPECSSFEQLPQQCSAANPQRSCPGTSMRRVPLAGSPGPSYFPVPYPDGVGIKISRNHIVFMEHHLQNWFDPQIGEAWVNVYTRPARRRAPDGRLVENVEKEAHVLFDGSGTFFLVPPHTIGRTQGLWVAPRNIELYGLTAHSHKRNILFTADLVGSNGEPLDSLPRTYRFSHPYCGGLARISSQPGQPPAPDDPVDVSNPPRHLYESIDWTDHEQCPFWREDGNNDREGAIVIRQGQGIRYECWVNNGVLPFQTAKGLAQASPDPTLGSLLGTAASLLRGNAGSFPTGTLAVQAVPIEPRDAFGRPVRGKFSCEEIPGVVPGIPFFGAIGLYQNKPCLPDVLREANGTPKDPADDALDPSRLRAVLAGGPSRECDPNESWQQFGSKYVSGHYTGQCVPASIGFAESEDDEMCILLGLYAFTEDDLVPSPVDRLPTDVGR